MLKLLCTECTKDVYICNKTDKKQLEKVRIVFSNQKKISIKLSNDYQKNEKFKQYVPLVRVEKISKTGPPKNKQCTSEI